MYNILLITPAFEQGGTETYIVNLIDYLKENNYYTIVISNGGIRENEMNRLGIKHIKVKCLTPKRLFNLIKAVFLISSLIKKEKIALIHASSVYTTIIAKCASLLCWTRRSKVVMTLHGGPTQNIEKKSAKILNVFADKVIALSEEGKNVLIRNGLNKSKVTVINNGIKPLIKKEQDSERDKIIIGACGRLTEQKGYSFLIEAVRNTDIPNLEIWIIGDGELRVKFESMIEEYQLADKIKIFGYRRDIENLLNDIDIFIQTSLWEPFGISIIEAMSLGKPVIATRVGGIPEVLGDCGILINPESPSEIADAIKLLVNNEQLRKELGEKAEKRFYENFTQEIMGSKTLEVYKKLLNKKQGRQ